MTTERTPAAATTRYALFILGMHRSGTSALSGMLHHLGAELPQTLMPATERNPKGYFESLEIQKFDDQLLKAAQSSWQDWRPLRPEWFASPAGQALRPEAREVLTAEFGEAPLIVIKDPRICRMVPFWDEVARDTGYTPCYILTHRNPMEVARSLVSRDSIDMSKALLLWLRHVLDAEAGSRGKPRFVTNYEMLLQNWPAQVVGMQDALDILLPGFDAGATDRIEDFLSRDLRHHAELPEKVTGNPTLSVWIRDTYEILERWVASGAERSKDYKRLDEIRKAFDVASPLFGQMLSHAETCRDELHGKLAERGKALSDTQAAKAAAEQQCEALRQSLSEAQAAGEAKAKAAADAQAAKAAAEQEREALRQSLAASEEALAAREAELDSSRQECRRLEEKVQDLGSALSQRRAEIADTSAELRDLRNELETRVAGFGVVEARLLETTVEARRLKVENDRRDAELSQLTGQLIAQEEALTGARTEARTHAAALEDLRRTLDETVAARGRADASASGLGEQVAALQAAEAELNGMLEALRGEVAVLRDNRETLNAELHKRDWELAQLGQTIVLQQNEIEEIIHLRAQLGDTQSALAEREKELTAAEQHRAALLQSTSWRVTAPARWIVGKLRPTK